MRLAIAVADKRNALGKLDLAQTPVLEQGAEDRAIQRV